MKFRNAALPIGLTQALNLTRATRIGEGRWHRLVSTSASTQGLVVALSARQDVEYVEPNYIVQGGAVPNDPLYSQLWGMTKISAPTAWNYGTGSNSVVVGIVDSGIDYTHPDLAANTWNSPAFSFPFGSCNSGSRGFNAITGVCDPMDDHGHGTHVSGTIGAVGNNSLGVTGVNWASTLMGLKFLGSNNLGSISDAIEAIEFAIQARLTTPTNIRVLNNSWWNGGDSEALREVIRRAARYDMLFVAIAGNAGGTAGQNIDQSRNFPGSYSMPEYAIPNVLTVAATNAQDQLSPFSSYGPQTVQLAAPGGGGAGQANILSTCWPGQQYCQNFGTSMAAPHVAGSAALLLANSNCMAHTLGLKLAIAGNVDPVTPALPVSSGGRLNAYRALRGCALQNVEMYPTAGDSSAQTFVYTFRDMLGANDLNVVNVLINDYLDGHNACHVAYSKPDNKLYLIADDGETQGPGYTPGSQQTLSNSQCEIDVQASGTTISGNVLTLWLATYFKTDFAGTRVFHLAARDSATAWANSGWQPVGTWRVPPHSATPPTVTGWTPIAATGLTPTFTAQVTDHPKALVNFLINSSLTGVNACYIAYLKSVNRIYLVNDTGTALVKDSAGFPAFVTPGQPGNVENTQCKISGPGSQASASQGTLTLSVNTTFFPGFQGHSVAYVAARDEDGGNSGWQRRGTWK